MRLPENPNIPWLKQTMRELGLNCDRVIDDMCYGELAAAYPEYVGLAKRYVETADGPRAMYALKMFGAGVVDDKWTDEIIAADTDTHKNNVLHFLEKVKDKSDVLQLRYEALTIGITK
jgi:hypothetical protein